MKKRRQKMKYKIFLMLALFPAIISAQNKLDYPEGYYETVAFALLIMLILIFSGFVYFGMGKEIERKKMFSLAPLFLKLKYALTKSVPLEKEEEITLEHDFDGIKELDNRIPPWFTYLFYLTIIFAAWYMIDYHVLGTSKLSAEEYEEEMAIAAAHKEALIKSGVFITEETVTLLMDTETLNAGRMIYNNNCVTCHGPEGGGMVGPNLTDNYWIHGGSIQDVFRIIKYGVPEKGMIPWQQQLNPKQIQDVSNYVVSLRGTNPSNAKQPEGEKFIEEI
jgi:cytochrome c oxidase cbb3-type subunit III